MDVKYANTYRTGKYMICSDLNDNKHHYEIDGVLPLVMPRILFQGNAILTSFLQLIDCMLVNMMKTVEKIKNYKSITSY